MVAHLSTGYISKAIAIIPILFVSVRCLGFSINDDVKTTEWWGWGRPQVPSVGGRWVVLITTSYIPGLQSYHRLYLIRGVITHWVMRCCTSNPSATYCGWLYFRGYTNFRGLKKNQTFLGFKICGNSIFLNNSYRKSLFRLHWNLWMRPSTKTSTPRKLSHPQYLPTNRRLPPSWECCQGRPPRTPLPLGLSPGTCYTIHRKKQSKPREASSLSNLSR